MRNSHLFRALVVTGASLTGATGCGGQPSVDENAARDAAADGSAADMSYGNIRPPSYGNIAPPPCGVVGPCPDLMNQRSEAGPTRDASNDSPDGDTALDRDVYAKIGTDDAGIDVVRDGHADNYAPDVKNGPYGCILPPGAKGCPPMDPPLQPNGPDADGSIDR
jgi:hypothetical protein